MSRKKKKHLLEEPGEAPVLEASEPLATELPSPEVGSFETPVPTDGGTSAASADDTEIVAEVVDIETVSLPEQDESAAETGETEMAEPLATDTLTEESVEPEGDAALDLEPAEPEGQDPTDAESAESESAESETPEISTERVVEAILFASDEPLTPAKIVSILGTGSAREVRKIIQTLNAGYTEAGHAFRIEEIAGGYQMLTLPEYNTWLRRLRQSRQDSRLTPAAMETLAVIAYKQPVVRAEIEAVRGVSVGEVLNRLRELGMVKIVGRAEDVGRPMLYGTTKHFLELFGLGSLEDLPAIEELQMPK